MPTRRWAIARGRDMARGYDEGGLRMVFAVNADSAEKPIIRLRYNSEVRSPNAT